MPDPTWLACPASKPSVKGNVDNLILYTPLNNPLGNASIMERGNTTVVNVDGFGDLFLSAPIGGFEIGPIAALLDANASAMLRANFPAASESFIVMTGTATKGGFDTGTVTLPQLAQVFKALLDGLYTHGLIFNGTE